MECLGGAHRPLEVNSYNTAILEYARASHLQLCNNQIRVREVFSRAPEHQRHRITTAYSSTMLSEDRLSQTGFTRIPHDNRLAPSVEDLDSSKSWITPSPLWSQRQRQRLIHTVNEAVKLFYIVLTLKHSGTLFVKVSQCLSLRYCCNMFICLIMQIFHCIVLTDSQFSQ